MTTPLTWITDRPPTEADADSDGDVAVKQRPTSNSYAYLHWRFVKPGTAWRRSDYWAAPEPADEPAPEPAAPTSQRRIVSISRTVYGATHTIDAVADDGTAWWKVPGETAWTQLPALPQREAE